MVNSPYYIIFLAHAFQWSLIQIDSYRQNVGLINKCYFQVQIALSFYNMVSEVKELKPEHNADTVDIKFD